MTGASGGVEGLRGRRIVALVGAGVSMVPPSRLPSYRQLSRAILRALTDTVGERVGDELGRAAFDALDEAQERGDLPAEMVAERAFERVGPAYFEALRCLDSDAPNGVHLGLAALARAGRLAAILTTNFDRLIERAFAQVGAPLEVAAEYQEFEALAARLGAGEVPDRCLVLKLHGSVEREGATMIDTMFQRRAAGLPQTRAACVAALAETHPLLVLGWSGGDLDGDPNYLGLRDAAAVGRELVWLVRSGTRPAAAAKALARGYRGPAAFYAGEMPGALDALWADLDVPAPTATPEGDEQLERRVAAHGRAWAEGLGPLSCAATVGDLLLAIGDDGTAAAVVEGLRRVAAEPERASEAWLVLTDAAAEVRRASGDTRGALGLLESVADRFAELDEHRVAAHRLTMGRLRFELGDVARAEADWLEAERIWRELDTVSMVGLVWLNLGVLRRRQGDLDGAMAYYEDALRAFDRMGREPQRAQLLVNMGIVAFEQGDAQRARSWLREAAALHARLGDVAGEAKAREVLAAVRRPGTQVAGRQELSREAIIAVCLLLFLLPMLVRGCG